MKADQRFVLPTRYKGVKFRSRREARWAVFFDTLGIQWLYEPEAYWLGEMAYLPDFWLPQLNCFWEVKAGKDDEEKMRRLVKLTGKAVYVHYGEIALNRAFFYSAPDESLYDQSHSAHKLWIREGQDAWDNFYLWCECPKCSLLGIEFEGRAARLPCSCKPPSEADEDSWHNASSPRILAAYRAAQRYRFW